MACTVLPRVYDLGRRAGGQLASQTVHDRLFDGYKRSFGGLNATEEGSGVGRSINSSLFSGQPHNSGVGEVGTGWMSYHQVPSKVLYEARVAFEVGNLRTFRVLEIARGHVGSGF